MRFSLSLFLPILDSDCPTADFPGNTIDQQMYNKNVICQIEQQCWIEQQQTEESERKAVSRAVQCIQFPNSTLNVCRAAVVGNLQIEKCFQRFKNQLKLTDWLTEDEQLNSKTQKRKGACVLGWEETRVVKEEAAILRNQMECNVCLSVRHHDHQIGLWVIQLTTVPAITLSLP